MGKTSTGKGEGRSGWMGIGHQHAVPIYVAIGNLLPELNMPRAIRDRWSQASFIALGIGTIALTLLLEDGV
jgi:hypothetical protein